MSEENVLVTGGAGFIGANLVRLLSEYGYRVRIYDNLSKGNTDYISDLDVEFVEGDIRDSDSLVAAMSGIDGVIHLAAYGSVVESVRNPVENFDVNAHGTFSVLDSCRHSHISRVVFASTGGALIGNAVPPVNEKSLPRPISPYGSSKLCGEAYCCSFAASYEMNITACRFANAYGPYSGHKIGAVTAFMKCIIESEPITIYGDGSATRDFLYVQDLCRGILQAFEKRLPGFSPIHLASGREVSVTELADSIILAAGRESHPILYEEKRVGEVEKNFATFDLASELLGFEPTVPLDEGILATWNWFLKNL